MTTAVGPAPSVIDAVLDSALQHLGLALDGAARSTALADLGQSLRQDPATGAVYALDSGGHPRVAVRDGLAVDAGADGIVDAVREITEKRPSSVRGACTPASVAASADNGLTSRMVQRRAEETADLRRQAEDIAATSNPWVSGNLTHRMLISRHLPEAAQRLKREAGR